MKNSVKEERQKINMTQQELADEIDVSRQTIFAIEKKGRGHFQFRKGRLIK
jgi:DNA-binding XRE family transcriptional regulator